MIRFRIAIAVLLVMGIFGGLGWQSDKDYHRYALAKGCCLFSLQERAPKNVDLLGLGGSRMMALLMPREVRKANEALYGKDISVINFGKTWDGPDYEYQLLSDIYSKGFEVKKILLNLNPQRKSVYHPLSYSFLSFSNMFDMVLNARDGYKVFDISFLVRSYLQRIRDLVFKPGEKYWSKRKKISELCSKELTCYPKDGKINHNSLSNVRKKINKRGGLENKDIEFINEDNGYYIYYYKKIIELAHKNNTDVYMIKISRMNEPIMSSSYKEKIEKEYGVPLLTMPIDLRNKLFDSGYRDPSHLYKTGRDIVIPWLLVELEK